MIKIYVMSSREYQEFNWCTMQVVYLDLMENIQNKVRLLGPWHVCVLVWRVTQKGRQTSSVLSQTLIYSVMLHASKKNYYYI